MSFLRQGGLSLSRQVLSGLRERSCVVRSFAAGAASKVVMLESFKNYQDHIKNQKASAVVYFTASWCPPCRAIKPIYEQLSAKYPKIAFGQLDVDAVEDAATGAGIDSVPAFHFYNKGNLHTKFVGADPGKLEETIKELTDKA